VSHSTTVHPTTGRDPGYAGDSAYQGLKRDGKIGSLAGVGLLAELNDEERAALEAKCLWLSAKKNDEILNRDSESRDVLFVTEGRLRIVNYSISGREVAYAITQAGDYFGEMSAIDGLARSATVVALEKCTLAALGPDDFNELLVHHPRIAIQVMHKLAKIIRICDDRIMDLATLSAYQRVYGEILRMKKADPVTRGRFMIYPLPTQAQIAAQASTTRETVARVLSQLTQAGIVERKGRTLYIKELEKLQTLAERLSMDKAASE